ncbi:hypothetical protein [Methanobacterium sp.]|uniref:hypothetical protein n=1 Tax=Methanobacterium sp. TaxID=2164 RepID=UPI003C77678F
MISINSKLLVLVMIAALLCLIIVNQQYAQDNKQNIEIKVPQVLEPQILGSNSKGTVIKSGPYGNLNSTRKIAIIVGVHPLEANSHRAIVESILNNSNSLNSSYYIYSIDVTENTGDYKNGRINGQQLASKYAVPDIKKNHFQLVIDVHSNKGKDTGYKENRFLSVPVKSNKSKSIASKIIARIPWLAYYIPPNERGPKSPKYVTIPLINSKIPSIVYEAYMYEPYRTTLEHADEFIKTVDRIKLN